MIRYLNLFAAILVVAVEIKYIVEGTVLENKEHFALNLFLIGLNLTIYFRGNKNEY